jgi:hypothetical protein
MNQLIKFWESTYYTAFLCESIIIIAFFISLKKSKQLPQLKLVPLYLGSFIVYLLLSHSATIFFSNGPYFLLAYRIARIGDFIVTIIEFFTFSYYLYTVLQTNKFKIIIKALSLIAFGMFLFYTIRNLYFLKPIKLHELNVTYIIESSALLLFCFFYFVELFKSPPVGKLLKSPDFWVSSGLMFYLICTFPVTIIANYLVETMPLLYLDLFIVIYIFYILLFLTIIKAYLCKSAEVRPYNTK